MKKKAVTAISFIIAVFVIILLVKDTGIVKKDEIKEFTAFFAVLGEERDEDNEIMEIIAQKTGARCREQWLTGASADEAIASYIASGEYPDFISGNVTLYAADALIPIDTYWDDYPNIKNYVTPQQWDRF